MEQEDSHYSASLVARVSTTCIRRKDLTSVLHANRMNKADVIEATSATQYEHFLKELWRCTECGSKVILCKGQRVRPYFRHVPHEGLECPNRTRYMAEASLYRSELSDVELHGQCAALFDERFFDLCTLSFTAPRKKEGYKNNPHYESRSNDLLTAISKARDIDLSKFGIKCSFLECYVKICKAYRPNLTGILKVADYVLRDRHQLFLGKVIIRSRNKESDKITILDSEDHSLIEEVNNALGNTSYNKEDLLILEGNQYLNSIDTTLNQRIYMEAVKYLVNKHSLKNLERLLLLQWITLYWRKTQGHYKIELRTKDISLFLFLCLLYELSGIDWVRAFACFNQGEQYWIDPILDLMYMPKSIPAEVIEILDPRLTPKGFGKSRGLC